MKLLDGPRARLPESVHATALTVGTFDGVHRGHLQLLAGLVACAQRVGVPSVLVTFEPHPLEVLNPDAAPLLLTTRTEKLAALQGVGVDYVALLPFTRELAAQSAAEFVTSVLRDRFRMTELLIGHDHGLGRGRAGDAETLRKLGAAQGFGVQVVAPVEMASGEPVSSTLVRRALTSGDLATASAALGREYRVFGSVVRGEARGRTLGFPTLNIVPESARKLLPLDGVYAVDVATTRGRFGGMMNLGGRPTFGDERRTIEVHLFDADGDFYGDLAQVGFVQRLRDVQRFSGPDALAAQLAEDERAARRALTALAGTGNVNGSTPVPPSTS